MVAARPASQPAPIGRRLDPSRSVSAQAPVTQPAATEWLLKVTP